MSLDSKPDSTMVFTVLRLICSSRGSCTILFYFLINLSFAFVELGYGIWLNSLGLITDSFQMMFDCTGLIIGLVAAAITRAQWRPNLKYSYGYGRVDAIAGMVNAICLLFVAFLLAFEAGRRINDVPRVRTEGLLYVSVGALCVNMLGILIVYCNTPSRKLRRRTLAPPLTQEVDDEGRNIYLGMLLHVIFDALGSLGVIISALLIERYQWYIADPICCIAIACLIILGVIPWIRENIDVLMQRSPRDLDDILPMYLEKIAQLKNVLRVKEPSFWTVHPHFHVATMRLEVHHSITRADKDALIWAVKEILGERDFKRVTVEIEDVLNFDRLPSI